LYQKSLNTLELPAILEMLASHAISDGGKEIAFALVPSSDIDSVKAKLEETTAAKDMMVLKSNPPISSIKDIRLSVKRAGLSGVLNTRELLDIAALLRTSASMLSYFERERGERESVGTAIDYLFNGLRANSQLENSISSAIVAEDEISDNASSELASIRRQIRLSADKVRQALNRIITSPNYSKVLQEPIITMRNDRYVVPVKSEQKSSLPGLVHDISSSGATHFIEPMAVVQINNELRELAAREKAEVDRILREISALVADDGDSIIKDYELLVMLDFVFAKAKLSYALKSINPTVLSDISVNLRNARHPLLDQSEAVPISIWLGGEIDTLIITGPNTGGKTVSLKTLGLLCAMAQCGLHIPADDGSMVPVFDKILADIGDEQSIEQSLSTFSSHMTNIVDILHECSSGALLLFDEMGAGTDPVEGAALAIAIIEFARRKGALIAATTHYSELKTFALTTEGVVNASCEFDVETLKPTYRLIIGIPGKSNAFAISARLGLPEAIIEDAGNRLNTENASFEDAISGLETIRKALEWEQMETKQLLDAAKEDRRLALEIKEQIDREHERAADNAKREAARILDDTRQRAESVMDQLRELQRSAAREANWQKLNDGKAEIYRNLNEADLEVRSHTFEDMEEVSLREPIAGDRVKLRGLGTYADVVSVNRDGQLTLQAGIMKITAGVDEVVLVDDNAQIAIKKQINQSDAKLRDIVAKPELDIRGLTTQEAIPILESYLDNAIMAKLVSVVIIHGRGTGAMRNAVTAYLRNHGGIKSFRLGTFGEGEDGVTIVEL